MNKFWWFSISWLIVTPGLIMVLVWQLQTSVQQSQNLQVYASQSTVSSSNPVYAPSSNQLPSLEYQVISGDARVEILRKYLESFDSPLATASADLVAAADKYDLDFRLLPAIARQESNGCKYIPPNSNNCWGWGIHKRGTLKFPDLKTAIYTVAQGLRERYLDDGLTTPEQIMQRYTPSSPGTWAQAVRQFMSEME